jgi:hypothetical protein
MSYSVQSQQFPIIHNGEPLKNFSFFFVFFFFIFDVVTIHQKFIFTYIEL